MAGVTAAEATQVERRDENVFAPFLPDSTAKEKAVTGA